MFVVTNCAVRCTLKLIVGSIKVINVHTEKLIVPLIIIVVALFGVNMRGNIEFIPVPDTTCSLNLVKKI